METRCAISLVLTVSATLLSGVTSWVVDDEGCPIGSRGFGDCVPLDSCPLMKGYIQQQVTRGSKESEVLSEVICGYFGAGRPKVCCPRDKRFFQNKVVPKGSSKRDKLKLLPLEDCGKGSYDDRITQGERAALMEFPWMALLKYDTADFWKTKCGGTLINSRYILTAAHCVDQAKPIQVILGEHNTATEKDCELDEAGVEECAPPTETYGIERIIVNENFNRTALWDDIALIRLDKDVHVKRRNIHPICLPVNDVLNKAAQGITNSVVAGWGVTQAAVPSEVLMKADVQPVENKVCENLYTKTAGKVEITKRQMCASGVGEASTCGGDSGGPSKTVVSINKKPRYVQNGIVSFRTVYCSNDKPVVFTKVAEYMDWILDTITA